MPRLFTGELGTRTLDAPSNGSFLELDLFVMFPSFVRFEGSGMTNVD